MIHVRALAGGGRRVLLLGVALALSSGAAWAQDDNVVASAERAVGPPVRTTLTVRDGADPLDRFEVTRLRLAGPQPPRGVLLLLPPAGNRFGLYEWDESGDPQENAGLAGERRRGTGGASAPRSIDAGRRRDVKESPRRSPTARRMEPRTPLANRQSYASRKDRAGPVGLGGAPARIRGRPLSP